MEAAVRHQTPGACTRKVACAQAAGLRLNVLLRFPHQKGQNSPGLIGQTGAGFAGSIFPDFELTQCPVPRAILSALLKLLLSSHPHWGLGWRGREDGRGGWLIDWALLLLPWFPWVPIVLLRKQDSAGVSALGYIYTHPAAQLLSFSQLQTAGEQDAFQRDHFLMVFILDFSGMISAFVSFWWRGVGGRRRKNPELVGTALRCQCRRLLFLPGIKGERLPSSLGFICHSARFMPGNLTSQSHSTIQGHCEERHVFIPWLSTTTPAWVKTEQKVPVKEEGRHSSSCGIWLGLDSGYHHPWVWSWVIYLSSQSLISPNSPLRELLLVLNWGGTWKEGEACASFLWLMSETPSAVPASPVQDTTSSGPGTCGEQPKAMQTSG